MKEIQDLIEEWRAEAAEKNRESLWCNGLADGLEACADRLEDLNKQIDMVYAENVKELTVALEQAQKAHEAKEAEDNDKPYIWTPSDD